MRIGHDIDDQVNIASGHIERKYKRLKAKIIH